MVCQSYYYIKNVLLFLNNPIKVAIADKTMNKMLQKNIHNLSKFCFKWQLSSTTTSTFLIRLCKINYIKNRRRLETSLILL